MLCFSGDEPTDIGEQQVSGDSNGVVLDAASDECDEDETFRLGSPKSDVDQDIRYALIDDLTQDSYVVCILNYF